MKPTFTNQLKSLLIGSAVAVSAASSAQAAAAPAEASSFETRVEKVREAASDTGSAVRVGTPQPGDADMMWWRNAWGNGGWHNWHNGWRNGGWGNWHNW